MYASCPRCGTTINAANQYCPNCGASLTTTSTTKSSNYWKPITGLFAVLMGLSWITTFVNSPSTPTTPTTQFTTASPSNVLAPAATLAPSPSPAASTTLTPTQHITEARRALGGTDGSLKKTPTATQLAAARWHLEAVEKGTREYTEARGLLADVTKRERASAKPTPTPAAAEEEETAALDDEEETGTYSVDDGDYSTPAPAAPRAATRAAAPVERTSSASVYVTRTGEKYHRAGCQYLSRSQIPIALADARSGYSPCSRCHPPR